MSPASLLRGTLSFESGSILFSGFPDQGLPLFSRSYKCKQPTKGQPFACVSNELSSRSVSRQVFSPQQSLTSVFGMGTGGPSALKAPTNGAPPGTRTPDPLIKSQLLYQLS